MLHGIIQSSKQFEQKTGLIRDELRRAFMTAQISRARDIQFTFIDAPFRLKRDALPSFDLDGAAQDDLSDEPDAFTWWHLAGRSPPFTYRGLDTSLSKIADTILKYGPFDGIVGFRQGATLAAMVASLLERGRKSAFDEAEASGGMRYPQAFVNRETIIQPPLKFVVAVSGFGGIGSPLYQVYIASRPILIESISSSIQRTATVYVELHHCARPVPRCRYHPFHEHCQNRRHGR